MMKDKIISFKLFRLSLYEGFISIRRPFLYVLLLTLFYSYYAVCDDNLEYAGIIMKYQFELDKQNKIYYVLNIVKNDTVDNESAINAAIKLHKSMEILDSEDKKGLIQFKETLLNFMSPRVNNDENSIIKKFQNQINVTKIDGVWGIETWINLIDFIKQNHCGSLKFNNNNLLLIDINQITSLIEDEFIDIRNSEIHRNRLPFLSVINSIKPIINDKVSTINEINHRNSISKKNIQKKEEFLKSEYSSKNNKSLTHNFPNLILIASLCISSIVNLLLAILLMKNIKSQQKTNNNKQFSHSDDSISQLSHHLSSQINMLKDEINVRLQFFESQKKNGLTQFEDIKSITEKIMCNIEDQFNGQKNIMLKQITELEALMKNIIATLNKTSLTTKNTTKLDEKQRFSNAIKTELEKMVGQILSKLDKVVIDISQTTNKTIFNEKEIQSLVKGFDGLSDMASYFRSLHEDVNRLDKTNLKNLKMIHEIQQYLIIGRDKKPILTELINKTNDIHRLIIQSINEKKTN